MQLTIKNGQSTGRTRKWTSCLIAAVLGLGLAQGLAQGDITVSRMAAPNEHATMMKVSTFLRHTHYNETAEFCRQHPNSKYAQKLQAKMAFAHLKKFDNSACLAMCNEALSKHGKSDRVAAAWMQNYISRCLAHQKDFTGAVDQCLQALTSSDIPEDLTPVLGTQRNLALMLLCNEEVTLDMVTKSSSKYADSDSLLLMTRCSQQAEAGNLGAAHEAWLKLTHTLPEGDWRIALAGTGLVMSTCYFFDEHQEKDVTPLHYCEHIIADIEQECPKQSWLVARAKLTLANAIMRSQTDYPKAELYFRDVIKQGVVTDLLPEAYTMLANTLYHQERYTEAAAEAAVVKNGYPYSSWADFACFMCADCTYRAGQKSDALRLFDDVIATYPESGWNRVAQRMKEVASR